MSNSCVWVWNFYKGVIIASGNKDRMPLIFDQVKLDAITSVGCCLLQKTNQEFSLEFFSLGQAEKKFSWEIQKLAFNQLYQKEGNFFMLKVSAFKEYPKL